MLGFTRQEQAIVLFLIFSLITGSIVSLYQRFWGIDLPPQVNTDYVEEFTKRAKEINGGVEPPSSEPVAARSAASEVKSEIIDSAVSKKTKINESKDSSDYFLVNINTASLEELQTIPRVGPVLAQKIIDYRTKSGGFKSLEELTQVKGIGKATFNKIRPYVSIN